MKAFFLMVFVVFASNALAEENDYLAALHVQANEGAQSLNIPLSKFGTDNLGRDFIHGDITLMVRGFMRHEWDLVRHGYFNIIDGATPLTKDYAAIGKLVFFGTNASPLPWWVYGQYENSTGQRSSSNIKPETFFLVVKAPRAESGYMRFYRQGMIEYVLEDGGGGADLTIPASINSNAQSLRFRIGGADAFLTNNFSLQEVAVWNTVLDGDAILSSPLPEFSMPSKTITELSNGGLSETNAAASFKNHLVADYRIDPEKINRLNPTTNTFDIRPVAGRLKDVPEAVIRIPKESLGPFKIWFSPDVQQDSVAKAMDKKAPLVSSADFIVLVEGSDAYLTIPAGSDINASEAVEAPERLLWISNGTNEEETTINPPENMETTYPLRLPSKGQNYNYKVSGLGPGKYYATLRYVDRFGNATRLQKSFQIGVLPRKEFNPYSLHVKGGATWTYFGDSSTSIDKAPGYRLPYCDMTMCFAMYRPQNDRGRHNLVALEERYYQYVRLRLAINEQGEISGSIGGGSVTAGGINLQIRKDGDGQSKLMSSTGVWERYCAVFKKPDYKAGSENGRGYFKLYQKNLKTGALRTQKYRHLSPTAPAYIPHDVDLEWKKLPLTLRIGGKVDGLILPPDPEQPSDPLEPRVEEIHEYYMNDLVVLDRVLPESTLMQLLEFPFHAMGSCITAADGTRRCSDSSIDWNDVYWYSSFSNHNSLIRADIGASIGARIPTYGACNFILPTRNCTVNELVMRLVPKMTFEKFLPPWGRTPSTLEAPSSLRVLAESYS